jgi:hypothetical protein
MKEIRIIKTVTFTTILKVIVNLGRREQFVGGWDSFDV